MKFSAGLLGYASSAYPAARNAALAAHAESLGYDAWWVADQRWGRDVWILLAACATTTSRIGLGTRITDPYARHPALTAVALGTLDDLSGGRAILGMGAGGSGFSQLGIERRKPVTAMREAITLIRGLLAGEETALNGEIVRFERGRLEFATRVPSVVIAGRGPKVLRLGGQVADGVMIASLVAPQALRWAIGHIRTGAERSRRDPAQIEVATMAYVAISDDDAAARWSVRRGIVAALRGSYPSVEFLRVSGLSLPSELRDLLERKNVDTSRLMEAIPEAFVDALAIAGSAERCVGQIEAIMDAGVDHLVFAPLPPEGEDAEGLLTRLADQVVARLSPRASAGQHG